MADKIMKTLNGYEVYDEYARTQVDSIKSGNITVAKATNATTSDSCTGNSATATKLAAAKTISLTGDVTGSSSFDGSGDLSITATVADDSHNHIISNVDGLQAALDGKSDTGHTHPTLTLTDSNGKVLSNGTYDGSVAKSIAIKPSEIGASEEGHVHTALVNSQGGVVNLLYNTDTTYALVPKSGSTGTVYQVSLGRGGDEGFYNLWLEGKASIEGGMDVSGANTFNGITTVYARIQPTSDDGYAINLGLAANRWANIFSKSAVNVSSDLTVKTDLAEIDDRYIELFDLVQPYAYKFIDGNSGRVHTGFISQYVEQAMEQVGLKDTDLAFFCKDALFEEIKDEDGNVIGEEPVLDEDGNQKYFYSLRYEEYIAIMTEKIKRMEKRIDELETKLEKVDEIEARLAALETA